MHQGCLLFLTFLSAMSLPHSWGQLVEQNIHIIQSLHHMVALSLHLKTTFVSEQYANPPPQKKPWL